MGRSYSAGAKLGGTTSRSLSAMRHINPSTVTLLLSAFPQMGVAVVPAILAIGELPSRLRLALAIPAGRAG